MRLFGCGALLLFALSALGQQQAHPPYNPPPYATPPTFPEGQRPTVPMPPDTEAPIPNSDVQKQIQKKLTTEPLLAEANVKAAVDDKSVVLTGTVTNEQQHDVALRIARSYAGDRNVVDKLQIRQRTSAFWHR